MAPPSTRPSPSWYEVSDASQELLEAAVHSWDDTSMSSQHIQQALAQPNVELEVLISAYRYYFYKGDAPMTLQISLTVVKRIRQAEQWPADWETLKPILEARLNDSTVRLYLNAYGASGLALARLGSLDCAQLIAEQVKQLGAKEFGADVLLTVLNPPPEED
ncbi:MAG: hypothetical protein AAFY26_12955 [Cyanobacteria bacterium J06638_22]